jgi:hypothetical protein
MKLRSFLIIIIMLFGFTIAAQTVYQDVVLTKDGSTYKGIIMENRINDYIKIEIGGGSIIKVDYSNVLSINKEAVSITSNGPRSFSEDIFYDAKAKLTGLKLTDLKKVNLQDLGIAGWSLSQKARLYDGLKRDDAVLPFVLNLVLPFGVGSYIQGDTSMGTYQLVSQLGFVLGMATGLCYTTHTAYGVNNWSNSYTEPNALLYILATNSTASYIAGLITPWTYQNSYNSQLRTSIGY